MKIERICVYCASSSLADVGYRKDAEKLGNLLAKESVTVVYGGGAAGSMGALAQGALKHNGKVVGIIPEFMVDLEWANHEISELIIVKDMQERRKKMIVGTDAVIALPGGSGTLEELIEAITLKRLGFYLKPIIIVNTDGFYDPFIQQMNRFVDEKFMNEKHRDMWTIVNEIENVIPAISSAPLWTEDARHFAAVR